MTSKRSLLCLAFSVLAASSCATVDKIKAGPTTEPWANFGKGTTTISGSTGWAFYQGKASAAGQPGALEGENGTDTATLTPNYGAALTLRHMVTDNLALGGIIEYRSFNPDTLSPLSADLTAGDFETWHFIATSRYFFDGLGETQRWRPFIGLDLSYIPEVDLGSVDVVYTGSTASFPSEQVNIVGSDYWAIAPVVGMGYQLSDDLSLDMGAFYEYAITTSDASIEFQSLGGARADMALRPQGLILFIALTYAF